MIYIYVLRNKANRKLYVGQTAQSISKRMSNHCYANTKIGTAFRKYGPDGFDRFSFIVPNELADDFEQGMIQRLDTIRNGYNLTEGGHVFKMSQESIEKIRIFHLGPGNPFRGKHHSVEAKSKISETLKALYRTRPHHNKGIHLSEDQRRKISQGLRNSTLTYARGPKSTETRATIRASLMGRFVGEANPNYGKHCSEETKNKISLANKGRLLGSRNPRWGKHFSDETRKKMSESHRGIQAGELNPRWGKHCSDETKRLISLKARERCKQRLST